jgi:transcriptional regulator with XRE-family HTH domain
MSEVIANNIKYLRRMNGLTQEQFARKIGIKRSLLGAYEEGRANPNLENLTNIAKIFGTTVDNLIKNDIRTLREKQGIPIPQPATQLMEPNDPAPPKPLASLIDKYYQKPTENPPLPQTPFTSVTKAESSLFASPGDLFQKPASQSALNKNDDDSIAWVSQAALPEYMTGYAYKDYLEKLPEIVLPTLRPGKYRAFETGNDFPSPGATVVGEFVPNWYDIRDGHHYLVVLHKQGALYRRVYNHVKIKGTVLLLSDSPTIPTVEVPVKDVLEFWEARQYIGQQMPEPQASLPLEKLMALVIEMQKEIENLRK